jgi:hypothetical protein
MEPKNALSIWLVVGISLLVNGVLILGTGLYELIYPPMVKVVMYQFHASIWWGALMAILGAIYCYKFFPRKHAKDEQAAAANATKVI